MLRCLGKNSSETKKKSHKPRTRDKKEKSETKRRRFSIDFSDIIRIRSRPSSSVVGTAGYESAPEYPNDIISLSSINFESDGTPIVKRTAEIDTQINKKKVKTKKHHHGDDRTHGFLRAARSGDVEKMKQYFQSGISSDISNANGLNAMHLASKEGNIDVVQMLIENGLSVDIATKKGNTSLHIASLAGKLEVVRLLINNGANINIKSHNGFTPLYMGAQENHYDVVELLLEKGANQAVMTDDGFTPLAVALQQNNDKVVRLLLDNDSRTTVRLPALHIAAKKGDVNAASLLLGTTDDNVDHQSPSGFTALHIAAHYNNVDIAKLLLSRKANVNFPAKNNITPLHVASKWGRKEMAIFLLDNGAIVDFETRDGLTPLHCAAKQGHTEVIGEVLLLRGANINKVSKNGLSALHMATQGDQGKVCQLLINEGCPVDATTMDYLTALHVSSHCGNVVAADVLLKNGSNVNARALNGFTPLHIACKKNQLKMVELLIKYGANISSSTETGLTPLHIAAFMGTKDIVILLLRHGASVSQSTMKCENSLHLATRNCQEDTLRLLLAQPDAQVNAKARENQTPLHIAVRVGNYNLVDQLLHKGADANMTTKDNYTPLHIAAKEGRHEISGLLLGKTSRPDAKTKKGFTPLHIAAKYGRIQVARQLLMSAKVDANCQGHNGLTPLHVATYYNHCDLIELLLDTGAQINCCYKNGYQPLHLVSKNNMINVAKILIDHGADVNAQSQKGFTALHLNAMAGNRQIVELLLEANADINHQSENGLTALHLAVEKNRIEIVQLLLSHGVDQTIQTRLGYLAIHTAVHFGQIQVLKMLFDANVDDNKNNNSATELINQQTQMGCTVLHLAAQQGHLTLVIELLDRKIDPNIRNKQLLTSLDIAKKQHYLNIAQILSKVTKKEPKENDVTSSDQKLILDQPEKMADHSLSDSEDEGEINCSRYVDQNEFDLWNSLVYDRGDMSRTNSIRKPHRPVSIGNVSSDLNYRHPANVYSITPTPSQKDWEIELESVQLIQRPVKAGFLISFIVDAQGGIMQAQRHPDLKLFVPPGSVEGPTRVICHLQRKENYLTTPVMEESEALASRLIHVNASCANLEGPILIEVPHNAALRHGEREIVVLKSEDGANWTEHSTVCSDVAIQDALGQMGENLPSTEYQTRNRIQRIITSSLPQFYSLVTRPKQDFGFIGAEGGIVTSSVTSHVQVVFPEGALMKKMKIAIQVQNVAPNVMIRYFGTGVAASPIVTLEPRRRKFHKPITLTLPVPVFSEQGKASTPSNRSCTTDNLRLLCSISGHGVPTVWEDITGTSPLHIRSNNISVSFTTAISARVWLIDCSGSTYNAATLVSMATELYKTACCVVPFIGRLFIYARRYSQEEVQLRCLLTTDDTAQKTLECQENFQLISSGPPMEVLENHKYWLEHSGNFIPVTKSNDQLSMKVIPFHENRLSFIIRIRDLSEPFVGKVAFMEDARQEPSQVNTVVNKPICVLDLQIPDQIIRSTMDNVSETEEFDNQLVYNPDLQKEEVCKSIVKSELNIREVANKVGDDWQKLCMRLEMSMEEMNKINSQQVSEIDKAYVALLLWISTTHEQYKGNRLEESLRSIGREDVVKTCIHNVTSIEENEKTSAETSLSDRISKSVSETSPDESAIQNDLESDSEPIIATVVPSKVQPVDEETSLNNDDLQKLKEDKLLELIGLLESTMPDSSMLLIGSENDDEQNDAAEEEILSPEMVTDKQAVRKSKPDHDFSAVPQGLELDDTDEMDEIETNEIIEKAEDATDKVLRDDMQANDCRNIKTNIPTRKFEKDESSYLNADITIDKPNKLQVEVDLIQVNEKEIEEAKDDVAEDKDVVKSAPEAENVTESTEPEAAVEEPIESKTEEVIESAPKYSFVDDDNLEASLGLCDEEEEIEKSANLINEEDSLSPDEMNDDINEEFARNYEAALSFENLSNNGKCTASLANISDTMTSPSSNESKANLLDDYKTSPTESAEQLQQHHDRPTFRFFQDLITKETTDSSIVKLDSPVEGGLMIKLQDQSESTITNTDLLSQDDSSISSSIIDQSFDDSQTHHTQSNTPSQSDNLPTPINEEKSIVGSLEQPTQTVMIGKRSPEPYSTQSSGVFGMCDAVNISSSESGDVCDDAPDSGLPRTSGRFGEIISFTKLESDDTDVTNTDCSLASSMTLKRDSFASEDTEEIREREMTPEPGLIKDEEHESHEELEESGDIESDFVEVIEEFEEDPTLSPIIECIETTDSSSEKITKSSSGAISADSGENLSQIKEDEPPIAPSSASSISPRPLTSKIPMRIAYEIPREEEEYGEESSHDSYSTVVVAGGLGYSTYYEGLGSSMGSSLHSDFQLTPLEPASASAISSTSSALHPVNILLSDDSISLEDLGTNRNANSASTDAVFKQSSETTASISSDPLVYSSNVAFESSHSLPRTTTSKSVMKKNGLGRSIELVDTDSSSIHSSLKEFELLEKEVKSSIDSINEEKSETKQLTKDREVVGSYTSSLAEFEILEEAARHSDDNIRKSILSAYTIEGASSISESSSSSLAEFEKLEKDFIETEMKEEAGKIVRALEEGVLPTLDSDKMDINRSVVTARPLKVSLEDTRQSMRDSMSKIQQLLTSELNADVDNDDEEELQSGSILEELMELNDEDREEFEEGDEEEEGMESDSLEGSSRPGSILPAGRMMEGSLHSSDLSDSQLECGGVTGDLQSHGLGGEGTTEEDECLSGLPASMSVDSALSWSHLQSSSGAGLGDVSVASSSQDQPDPYSTGSSAGGVASGSGGGAILDSGVDPLSDIPQEPDDDDYSEDCANELEFEKESDFQLVSVDIDGNLVVVEEEDFEVDQELR